MRFLNADGAAADFLDPRRQFRSLTTRNTGFQLGLWGISYLQRESMRGEPDPRSLTMELGLAAAVGRSRRLMR